MKTPNFIFLSLVCMLTISSERGLAFQRDPFFGSNFGVKIGVGFHVKVESDLIQKEGNLEMKQTALAPCILSEVCVNMGKIVDVGIGLDFMFPRGVFTNYRQEVYLLPFYMIGRLNFPIDNNRKLFYFTGRLGYTSYFDYYSGTISFLKQEITDIPWSSPNYYSFGFGFHNRKALIDLELSYHHSINSQFVNVYSPMSPKRFEFDFSLSQFIVLIGIRI